MNRREFYDLLCCPTCKGSLQPRPDETALTCKQCLFVFPIVDQIPVIFPCDVASEMQHLFNRYWDSTDKAALYDAHVEGGDSIFGVYTHQSEEYGLAACHAHDQLDLVLDAGCGNGRFLATLPASSVGIGIDASLNLLMIARRKGRGHFHVCCELEHLPFRDGVFGTVFSYRVLQHLTQQELAVQELSRVTRDRGNVILGLYNTWNLKTLYKNIRMSQYRRFFNYPFKIFFRSMSPFDDWGLSYDNYTSWFEVKRWLVKSNIHGITGRGVGFGYHKYFFVPFHIDALLSKKCPAFLRSYYDACFRLEKAIGHFIPVRYFMEKFVINGTKNAHEIDRGVGAKVIGRLDAYLKSSILWNFSARRETKRERHQPWGLINENRYHIIEAVQWLKRAQDATPDRGVSRGYSVGWNPYYKARGWQPSYPETTGYIIPTLLDCADYLGDDSLRTRAVEMADWELKVQLPKGAVMGGTIDSVPTPAVFNTGQVILGWLRAYAETSDRKYLAGCERAAEFLLSAQSEAGGWYTGNSRFANANTTTYNSRVGWALILLGQTLNEPRFLLSGQKGIEFSLSRQNSNGWFRDNCLDDPNAALLHTICYATEGVWGAGEALQHDLYLQRATLAADQLLICLSEDGRCPGRFDSSWNGTVTWSCLTGNAQLAGIWLRLFVRTGDSKYQIAAHKLLRFLKATQNCVSPDPGLRGGIKGSYPFDGAYGRYEILNWATKFFIDALLLDERTSTNAPSLLGGATRTSHVVTNCAAP